MQWYRSDLLFHDFEKEIFDQDQKHIGRHRVWLADESLGRIAIFLAMERAVNSPGSTIYFTTTGRRSASNAMSQLVGMLNKDWLHTNVSSATPFNLTTCAGSRIAFQPLKDFMTSLRACPPFDLLICDHVPEWQVFLNQVVQPSIETSNVDGSYPEIIVFAKHRRFCAQQGLLRPVILAVTPPIIDMEKLEIV